MKITIDTAHDSEADIRNVIALLSSMVGQKQDAFSAAGPSVGNVENVFGIFENVQQQSPQQAAESEKENVKERGEPFKIDRLELY